jgi:short-subunit dehydrogenase
MKLQGKIAVITGASMGIGEAIAKLFLKEGARLVLCARDLARVEAATKRIAGEAENVLCWACDVSRRDQVDALMQAAVEKFGRIDILVNNAGFGLNDSIEKIDAGEFRRMFDTNFFGALNCMQAAIPVMRQQGGGDIANISSVAGHIATPYMGGYAASKHAMQAIGMAARMELKHHNINVVTICPGFIATDFAQNMIKGSQPQRIGGSARRGATADLVARDTLKAVARRKRQAVTPWFYWIAIKLYQNAPGLVESLVRKTMRPTTQVLAEAGAKQK